MQAIHSEKFLNYVLDSEPRTGGKTQQISELATF